jgi:hypothetical protein
MSARAAEAGVPHRLLWLVLLVGVLALVGPSRGLGATSTSDAPVVRALERGDTYVAPAFYDAAVAAQVGADAAQLAKRGESVKLAAVPFVPGDDLYAYAEALRTTINYLGTLVVTTPNNDVAAAGPRSQLSIQTALSAVGASSVADPAARLLVAAEVSTPPPADSSTGLRDLIILGGLALLGGAFAIGWGLRREQRRAHERTMEARGILKVYADALGARARRLADAPGGGPESRALVEAVEAYHVAADTLVSHATTERELRDGAASLRSGFGDAERAGALVGIPLPATEPFADLCSVDPAHGPITHPGEDGPLCAACAERLKAGHELMPRRVLTGGVPVSYRDARVPYDVTSADGAPVA